MKKGVIGYILEILLIIVVIFITLPIWAKLSSNMDDIKTHIANNNLELIASKDTNNNDNKLKTITSGVYNIINNSNYNASGKLLYKLDKSSTIDPKDLEIVIDDQKYDLKYYYINEDENYFIYLINTFNLNGKEKKTYNIKIIIKEEMYLKNLGKKYKYNISIENNENNIL